MNPLLQAGFMIKVSYKDPLATNNWELKERAGNAACESLCCHLMALFERASPAVVLSEALGSAPASSGIHRTLLTHCPGVLHKQSRGHHSNHSCCEVINYLHTRSLIRSLH